ncbi:unnamed protein product [Pseudo-nitzschia multistriata]|uniref:Sulfotransferase domain-containing protein n=1 Tax=Pseudo-nitzschia multistriata TaxID=183589 RepID=A0A448ZNJ5_9STRA|nr:unnamed protein product [Pseudo-nitzschia multistriata]
MINNKPSNEKTNYGVAKGSTHRRSRYPYTQMVLAVSFTALLTRQFTILFALRSCDNASVSTNDAAAPSTPIEKSLSSFFEVDRTYSKPRSASAHAYASTTVRSNQSTHRDDQATTKSNKKQSKTNSDDDNESVPFRRWKPFNLGTNPFPCYPPGIYEGDGLQSVRPCHEGILFQRPTKVGSTTMTNVVMRLAHNRGSEMFGYHLRLLNTTAASQDEFESQKKKLQSNWKSPPRCEYRSNHGTAVQLEYSQRKPGRSFLFGMVRDPTKRIISEFFHFGVSVYQKEPTDVNFQNYVLRKQGGNPLIRDMTFDKDLPITITKEWQQYLDQWNKSRAGVALGASEADPVSSPNSSINYQTVVADILRNYDFIAVTERMDESLVALKLLLGLDLRDVLYVKPSRSAGSFSNGFKDRPCVYLVPSFLTPGMHDFFHKPNSNARWTEYSKGDRLLHEAASRSLDATIEHVFGSEFFRKELEDFHKAQAYVEGICADRIVDICDQSGHDVARDPNRTTTCYIWSEGCDHECFDNEIPNPLPDSVFGR